MLVVKLKSRRVADALIDFAKCEGITQVVFGQMARSRWDILLSGSIINRFLHEVRDATVQVVPLEAKDEGGRMKNKTADQGSDYLWKEGRVPPTRKLTIKDVDRDELPVAVRWQTINLRAREESREMNIG